MSDKNDPFQEYRDQAKALRARIQAKPVPLFGTSTTKNPRMMARLITTFSDNSSEAFGFKEAAQILVSSIADGTGNADSLAFPIVFCYRHYVELMLKSILISAVASEYVTEKTFEENLYTHNLLKLWDLVRPALQEYDDKIKNDAFTKRVANRISELTKFDPDSMAYRYQRSKNGEARRLPDGNHPYIDLQAFCDGMNDVATYLDDWWDEWGRIVEFNAEMREMYGDEIGP